MLNKIYNVKLYSLVLLVINTFKLLISNYAYIDLFFETLLNYTIKL